MVTRNEGERLPAAILARLLAGTVGKAHAELPLSAMAASLDHERKPLDHFKSVRRTHHCLLGLRHVLGHLVTVSGYLVR